MTVNAGPVSSDHWTQNRLVGGGRIVGEACHFIDLLRFLAASKISKSEINYMASATNDTATINLKFNNGSIGSIHYFSNGDKSIPKERLEIFADGRVLVLDNFRKLTGYGWPNFSNLNLWIQNKGQVECVKAFVDYLRQQQKFSTHYRADNNNSQYELGKERYDNTKAPIPLDEILEVAEVTIELAR
jgi:predicted dehydrogenase